MIRKPSLLKSYVLTSIRLIKFASNFSEKGLFGVDILRVPSGFKKLNEQVKQKSLDYIDKIVNKKCDKKTVAVFDDLSNEICCAADLAECVRNLHSNPDFCSAAEESMRGFTHLVESLNTRTDLYQALKDSMHTERHILNDIDKRTILLFLEDFEQSGVHLSSTKKDQFVRFSDQIFVFGAQFSHGAEQPVKVSHSQREMYHASNYLTSPNSLTASQNTRKWSYSTYYGYNEEQEKNLRQLISCRHLMARLTGYKTYAHRAQQYSLLGTYENAQDFLHEIIKSCTPAAEREIAVLEDVLLQCESRNDSIYESDLHYLSVLYRENAFGHLQHLSQYFSFNNMLRGFELLTKKLYGVRFQISLPEEGEIWFGNLVKVSVYDGSNNFLGTIYIDIQDRKSKTVGDCHFTVRCSKQLSDGSFQTPIVVLSLRLTSNPEGTNDVFLSPSQAENFFHEMGHAMHSMLGRTEYQHIAGTRCSTDMAEIPSNLMEYFFNNIDVVREIAKDQNGRQISVEDAAAMIASRFAFTSLEMLQQAVYSLFDLEIHGNNADAIMNGRCSTSDIFDSLWSTVLPNIKRDTRTAWHHRFAHLVPYGARYYSYLVAKAAASLVWNTHFRNDPFNSHNGQLWAKVLSKGGSLPSTDLLYIILGYWPTAKDLAAALKDEANYTCQHLTINV